MAEKYKFIDEQKLDQVVAFALAHSDGDIAASRRGLNFDTYRMMVQLYGLDGKPQVVSEDDFKALSTPLLYRGMPKAEYHANVLCDPIYHVGQGQGCNGIYSIYYYRVAFNYTDPSGYSTNGVNRKQQNVLKLKISPDAKTEKLYNLKRELLSLGNVRPAIAELQDYITYKIPPQQQRFVMDLFCDDVAKIAVVAGIDVVEGVFGIKAILNRAKLVVSERELERIKSLCPGRKASAPQDQDEEEPE